MRSLSALRPGAVLGIAALLICTSASGAEDLTARMKQAFSQGIIDGMADAALKRGVPPAQAHSQAECTYGVLSANLTAAQWVELSVSVALRNEGQKFTPPEAVQALAPQIQSRCLHSSAAPAPSTSATPDAHVPRWDDADSARVAQELRRLRLQQEMSLRQARGLPQVLATGRCTADVRVGDAGLATGDITVDCSDERLQGVVREAVMAAAPIRVAAGSTVRLRVFANDPEPGVEASAAPAPIAEAAQAARDARPDVPDSAAVTQQVVKMRLQQVRMRLGTANPPDRPLFGQCSARVLVSASGLPAPDYAVDCSDPRLLDSMRQAIAATGTLRAPPGSMVLVRVRAPFPAP